MSEDTRKPLSEQHPVWQSALAAPFVPDTPEEAAYVAAHPIGSEGPPIPGHAVTEMLNQANVYVRRALCGVLDRLGADGACAFMNGDSPEKLSDEIFGFVRLEEE